jgi:hypothetical protein
MGLLASASGAGHADLHLPDCAIACPGEASEEGVFPSARPISPPAYHRQVLTWLFQDLVLWLIETDQIKFFRPYRN